MPRQTFADSLKSIIYSHRLSAEAAVRRGDHASALRNFAMGSAYSSARGDYLRHRDPGAHQRGLSEYRYLHQQANMAEAFLRQDPEVQVVPGGSQYERTAEALARRAEADERSQRQREAMEALLRR